VPGQQGPQGQQQPPQPVALPAQAGSGMGRLVIEAKASWMFWLLRAMGKPQISINGGPVPSQWGTNVYDLPDGQHNVHVVTNYFGNVGEAYVVEPVRAGQQSVLYYKAPTTIFHKGALDGNPGGYPGMGLQIGILIVLAVLIIGLVLVGVLLT